ncbi:MAG TPA: zinc-binding alcohol dehydrogenase family protein [Verrucomicrobiae bacterium]|nr:zinc-binding alcohol dehydrogenase family protein [Verrucomicrobiae bacterium]
MRAWLLDELNGIEHVRLADVADPVPGPGEAVLEVRVAALNPADRYLAERQYPAKPPLPHVLGRDGIGRVVQLGSGVSEMGIGDKRVVLRGEVGVNRWGTFAQRVSIPIENLVEAPSDWTDEEAAGATLVYLTAYQALTMWGKLPDAALVLVTGASGGVGVAAVQLAAAMGYTVVGLSRSPEKSRRLEQLGAAATFNPEDPQWREAFKARLSPRRVDLAIDNVGGKLLPEVIDTLGQNGRVSLVGRLAGTVPNFNTATLFFRRLRLGGVAVGTYTNAESRAAWQEVLRLLAAQKARPLVDSTFSFEELPKAFQRLAQGPMGKVLLQVK